MNIFNKIHAKLLPQDQELGYVPYLTLAYLAIFFTNLYFSPVSGLTLIAVVGALLVFLICYFRAYWCHGRQLLFCITAIFAVGVAMAQINVGASVFFVYAATFCASFNSQRSSMYALITTIGAIGLFSALTNQTGYFWIPAVLFSFIIGLMLIHQAELDRKNSALKLSQQQIQSLAKTAERERISRDLHDILGHSLSVITLKSELAGKMIDANQPIDKVREELKGIETLSRATLAQVRGAVTGYNNATFDTELLQARIATSAASIELIVAIDTVELPASTEAQLALIMREAITNIIRHADTTKAWITLTDDNDTLNLTISDEGCMTNYQPNSGLGNMKERIESLGGFINIQGAPQTILRFTLPQQCNIGTT